MPISLVNGVRLYYEQHGQSGEPLVLVHGSWGDHHNWDPVVPELARTFRVITYDRRGHSQSERPPAQGSIRDDAADLAALIEQLGVAPANVVGNSGGAAITLWLASQRPELFRTMVVHEPPLFGLLADLPEARGGLQEVQRRIGAVVELLAAGQDAAGAELFVETIAFGPGYWTQITEEMRQTFIRNAPTFLDETRDPEFNILDLQAIARFDRPALISHGTTSAPFFPLVVQRVARVLPNVRQLTLDGVGHVPHLTHPADYVAVVRGFVAENTRTVLLSES